jgi:hypothetical protein
MVATPISMINSTDPYFTPIGDPQTFPDTTLRDDSYGFNEYNCHMLSLCMKVTAGPFACRDLRAGLLARETVTPLFHLAVQLQIQLQ